MALKIQRVPRGLGDLLSVFGGQTPQALADEVRGIVELLQFYGLSQRRVVSAQNAAAAENGGAVLTFPRWSMLFSYSGTMVKTATMTAARIGILLNRGGNTSSSEATLIDSQELGPFGATETGAAACAALCPYPLICPPGTTLTALAQIIGTDATANVIASAEIGELG
jgi:hypothetical protein